MSYARPTATNKQAAPTLEATIEKRAALMKRVLEARKAGELQPISAKPAESLQSVLKAYAIVLEGWPAGHARVSELINTQEKLLEVSLHTKLADYIHHALDEHENYKTGLAFIYSGVDLPTYSATVDPFEHPGLIESVNYAALIQTFKRILDASGNNTPITRYYDATEIETSIPSIIIDKVITRQKAAG